MTRTGYGLARATLTSGLVQGMWAHVLVTSVFLLPVLAGAASAAAVLGAPKVAATASGLAGTVLLAVSVGLFSTPGLHVSLGPWAGAALGAAALGLSGFCTTRGRVINARRQLA